MIFAIPLDFCCQDHIPSVGKRLEKLLKQYSISILLKKVCIIQVLAKQSPCDLSYHTCQDTALSVIVLCETKFSVVSYDGRYVMSRN